MSQEWHVSNSSLQILYVLPLPERKYVSLEGITGI